MKFYSVGVGPGEPGYITLRAKQILDSVDIIAVPVKRIGEKSTALDIVNEYIEGKTILMLEFLMDKDINIRMESRKKAVCAVKSELDNGKSVAMITLGDPSVYSTASYILNELDGYDTEVVPGVPSFCASSAEARISLCEGNETLAVIPSVPSNFCEIIDMFDNIVIMKAGNDIDRIYSVLKERGLEKNAVVTSRVTMDGSIAEPIERGKRYGYFTTVIVKKGVGI